MSMVTNRVLTQVDITPDVKRYIGRGARERDLSGETLAKIYNKIKEELGDEAASEFVTMVRNIKLLSLVKFIKSLQALEANQWRYSAEKQDEINKEKESEPEFFAYFSERKDDTTYIKNVFLAEIGEKHDVQYLRFEGYMRAMNAHRDRDYYNDFDSDYSDDNAEYE